MNRISKMGRFAIASTIALGAMVALSGSLSALQPDAPFMDFQAKNKSAWAAEDRQIDEKLAALEKRFGKKPNIIYILADDVGWGEMGWQGAHPTRTL